MCISPITIPVKPRKDVKTFEHPKYLRLYQRAVESPVFKEIRPRNNQVITVNCGKCVECLRKRQNDLAVRCAAEAEKRGKMIFATLTYNPRHLPFTRTEYFTDTDTGEILRGRSDFVCIGHSVKDADSISEIAYYNRLRDWYAHKPRSNKPIYLAETYGYIEDQQIDFVYTPSVCRKDISLWLKSSRVAFERQFGHKLPDFSYLAVQEYGPKTCRPHVHIGFFGLDKRDATWLCARWSDKKCLGFGSYQMEVVKPVNDDGSYGIGICARYIGKYCSKGVFECSSVKGGFAQKPRLMISKHFGEYLSQMDISYFRCDDLLGKVDLMSLKFKDTGEPLSVYDLQFLAEEVRRRAVWKIAVGSDCEPTKFALPRSYVRKIWYFYDSELKSFRAYPLRKALTLFAPPDPLEDYINKLIERYPGISHGTFVDMVRQYSSGLESNLQARKKRAEEYLSRQYKKSNF